MTSLLAQTEQTEPFVRSLWPFLLLTGMGVVGVVLLALARRHYHRKRKLIQHAPPGEAAPTPTADAWDESAKRLNVSEIDESEDE